MVKKNWVRLSLEKNGLVALSKIFCTPLDQGAVQEHFPEFIADGSSADQIEFVGMVIEHLCRNGFVDPGLLYERPFTDNAPDGPDGVFDEAEVEDFLERLRTMNRTALVDVSVDVG